MMVPTEGKAVIAGCDVAREPAKVWKRPSAAIGWCCCIREKSWPKAPRANCARASAATSSFWRAPILKAWPPASANGLVSRRWCATRRCASKSPMAIALSRKWWRRSRVRWTRWGCTSHHWKTSSSVKQEHRLNSFLLPAATLWQRELVRFWRQKSRVLGVVASPLVFWLVIGSGSNDLARFYSGSLVLTVMFSAIFSTISIIEDRREGFLLSMLVSPAPRTSMVLGKILGAATLAWIQGLIFLCFAPLAGVSIEPIELIPVAAAILLISFTLTGLGFVIAWKMDSTAGFHAIMNLLLVPMWMVSGSLFPMSTAHGWIKAIMWVNPLTYSISLLNALLGIGGGLPPLYPSLIVTAALGILLLLVSGFMANQKSNRSAA